MSATTSDLDAQRVRAVREAWLSEQLGCTDADLNQLEALIDAGNSPTGNRAEDLECLCVAYQAACFREHCCGWVGWQDLDDWPGSLFDDDEGEEGR